MNVWIRWSLVQWGTTTRYDVRAGAEIAPGPSGECSPPVEAWWAAYLQAGSDAERSEIERAAAAELIAYLRRPEPAPAGETLDDLIDRVVSMGEGWEVKDVALSLRVTPTFVRNARRERERNVDTGRIEGSLAHARDLLSQGLSERQVAMLTGIPRTSLRREIQRGLDRAA